QRCFPLPSRSRSFPVLAERRRTPPVRQNAAPEREASSMASGVDRISALPEDVLHSVLRFLPAQEVLRTCVLARRWRAVWRSVPTLLFTGPEGWGSAERFAEFVDNLLHLRCGGDGGAGAPLDSCEFNFVDDDFMLSPANQRRATNWIWKAVHRVRVLRLHVVHEQEPSPLSDLHLVSQHLTKLHLDGVSVNDSILDFSGCPALVELTMEYCDVFVKHLLSPSLKRLRFASCDSSEYTRILISLPSLVSLELIEWQRGRAPLLGSLPWLARAVVELGDDAADRCSKGRFDDCGAYICHGCRYYYHHHHGDPEYGPGYDRNDSIFLKGLSEATDLELSAESDVHSPVLEKLTFQLSKAPPNVMKTEGIYKPLGQSVASNCLKLVEIRCAEIDSRVYKILKTLTTYGISLEKINITSRISRSGCFSFVCTSLKLEV
uniref:F-box domain-containing protein n=1 Tax=Aegilops tauschii subsp. strangulata TaxID=200361 RepID=A0A453ISY1_AEGTS